jgi:deoxyribodipyrimidine photolyase
LLAGLCALLACQHAEGPKPQSTTARASGADSASESLFDAASYRRAEAERAEFYEREVERLRADLQQAEQSLVAMESGLRGFQSRADAVSALAEARIALERVSPSVPWRQDRVEAAHEKLAEASRQLQAGHVGSAVFFASRAQRITENLQAEVRQVAGWEQKSLVLGDDVELRTAPSGEADVVDILVAQTPVFPERSRSDWTLVRTPSGRIGWVRASRLSTP